MSVRPARSDGTLNTCLHWAHVFDTYEVTKTPPPNDLDLIQLFVAEKGQMAGGRQKVISLKRESFLGSKHTVQSSDWILLFNVI